jgi:hypothetical protein
MGMMMTAERIPCIRINAPEFFEDAEFVRWLESPDAATWHCKGKQVNDHSDAFMTYDHEEGSDYTELPEWIWNSICDTMDVYGYKFALLWITNLHDSTISQPT